MKLFFLLNFDSFTTTLAPVIRFIKGKGVTPDVALLVRSRKKNWVTQKIISYLSDIDYRLIERDQIKAYAKNEYDAAVLGTVGGRSLHRFIVKFRKYSPRTRIITGYAGALLNNDYGGFIHGLKGRLGSDIIWTPGEMATKKILQTNRIERNERVIMTGLPRFDDLFYLSKNWPKSEAKKQILFIEQPTFPKWRSDRKRLAQFLIHLAEVERDKTVVLKPRFSKRVVHAHPPKHLIPDLLANMSSVPENLVISDEHLYDHFPKTDYAISISSSGAVEAMLVNIPTYFISDFCGAKNRYGSADFKASNGVVTMDQILHQERPVVKTKWAQSVFRFDGHNTARLANLVLHNQLYPEE